MRIISFRKNENIFMLLKCSWFQTCLEGGPIQVVHLLSAETPRMSGFISSPSWDACMLSANYHNSINDLLHIMASLLYKLFLFPVSIMCGTKNYTVNSFAIHTKWCSALYHWAAVLSWATEYCFLSNSPFIFQDAFSSKNLITMHL